MHDYNNVTLSHEINVLTEAYTYTLNGTDSHFISYNYVLSLKVATVICSLLLYIAYGNKINIIHHKPINWER